MSSSSKSTNLGLNQWIDSDKPEMNDFNTDNSIVDNVLGSHINDVNKHITQSERLKWGSPYAILHYVGDGEATRSVSLSTGYVVNFCIVYAQEKPLVSTDALSGVRKHYCGFAGGGTGSQGLALDRSLLLVEQGASSSNAQDVISFNDNGVRYTVICFR